MKSTTQDRLYTQLKEALGPIIMGYLDKPWVEDIIVNPDGRVWVNSDALTVFLEPHEVLSVIHTVAEISGTICNADQPVLEAVLPFNSARFEGIVPPVVTSPVFAIRTRPRAVYSLEDYVTSGTMTQDELNILSNAISGYKNILIVGPTGSGKTALLNACIKAMPQTDRVVSIEDIPEIDCQLPNSTSLMATGSVTMTDCLRHAMRLRPKRIMVGEVRGGEALALLKAWNTGHSGGISTIHAIDSIGGLLRLEELVAEATGADKRSLISRTINMLVVIREEPRTQSGRRVTEIKHLLGFVDGDYLLEDI